MDIKEIKTEGYERVIRGCDEKSNFNSFIAIHTLKNGPAFGGIRYFNYRDNVRACLDVKKLAEAMTEKCAVAGIDLSGGKTAIQKNFYKDYLKKNGYFLKDGPSGNNRNYIFSKEK